MFSASGIIQGKSQFLAFDFRNLSSQGEEKECGLWTKDLKESLMTKSQGTTPINPPPLPSSTHRYRFQETVRQGVCSFYGSVRK